MYWTFDEDKSYMNKAWAAGFFSGLSRSTFVTDSQFQVFCSRDARGGVRKAIDFLERFR